MLSSVAGKLPAITLVLGGARSGKSRHAEAVITHVAAGGTYIATAEAGDAEMAARIAEHRARRDNHGRGVFWRTVEAPLDLAPAILAHAEPARPILVDCLTLWLSNLMFAGRVVEHESETLRAALREPRGLVVLVANEVGLGLVPETPLGRAFRDAAGRLNQDIATLADRVVFVAAGLPLVLRGSGMVHPVKNLPLEGEGRSAGRWEGGGDALTPRIRPHGPLHPRVEKFRIVAA